MGLIGSIIGAVVGGGGPSSEMMANANQSSAFATELLGDYTTMFNMTESSLNDLKNQYSSIAALGPSQHGYTSSVLNALNTQLLNSSAAAYRNSAAAVRNFMAGSGGGAAGAAGTSGIAAQIEGDIAAQTLNNVTSGQTKIALNDIALGNENWKTAMSGLNTVAGLEEKAAAETGQLSGSALNLAFGEQKEIHAEKQAAENAKWGAIAGLGDAALGMVTGGISAIGSGESFGEAAKDFLSGAFGGTGSPPPGGGTGGASGPDAGGALSGWTPGQGF